MEYDKTEPDGLQYRSCFYGGPITEKVYPAVLTCDALMMVCPNYNDALGANLTAFINRLTALFTIHRFYDKKLFAVIVSGYSGGDICGQCAQSFDKMTYPSVGLCLKMSCGAVCRWGIL